MATVLVVDDEPIVREVVVRYLEREGHRTLEAGDGTAARMAIETAPPDLVVLDVMLPGTDGLELCRWIRSTSELPVIMLTARGEEADRIVGLELGADDYVTKPFSPGELVARVRALMRRPRGGPIPDIAVRRFGDLVVDPLAREVSRGGEPVELTRLEFALLDVLSEQPRVAFSRAQLVERVWGPWFGDDHVVDVHVANLRRKLGDDARRGQYIRTVRGVGYRMGTGE